MSQYKHRRLVYKHSVQGVEQMPKVSRARKISTEADTVVSFVKPRKNQPCSTNFEKKFYLKRNSDIVEQRMCYTTRYDVKNKTELVKVLRLIADKDASDIEEFVNRGCINEAGCTDFVKSNLPNIIPIMDSKKTDQTDLFMLRNVSYDAYCNKYTITDQDKSNHFEKVVALKNLVNRSWDEKKVGDIYLEYNCAGLESVSFYVIIQVFEKPCSLKSSNTKQKLKKVFCQCTQEIRQYNLITPCSLINDMEELLQLDMSNWKKLNYKFKSSKDEAFYKQLRRKNRALCEV